MKSAFGDALPYACERGNVALAEQLLNEGADVDHRGVTGQTALHDAVQFGKSDCMWLLLKRGASINVVDDLGETPLFKAVDNREVIVVRSLLHLKADPNVMATRDGPALVIQFCIECAHTLLDYRADVHLHVDGGVSALQNAAQLGQWEIVLRLLECGAGDNGAVDYSSSIGSALSIACDIDCLGEGVDLELERWDQLLYSGGDVQHIVDLLLAVGATVTDTVRKNAVKWLMRCVNADEFEAACKLSEALAEAERGAQAKVKRAFRHWAIRCVEPGANTWSRKRDHWVAMGGEE